MMLLIPVDEEPPEAEVLLVPAGEECRAAPGTRVRDVIEVADGTVRALRGLRARLDGAETRQEQTPVPGAVDERVAHVPHGGPEHGEADPPAGIADLGGRLEELAETLIPQRPRRALHALHLETHVTHGVHRVVRMRPVETSQVPVVSSGHGTPGT